jgi:hypothetical protein
VTTVMNLWVAKKSDNFLIVVAITKLHASRSQQNCTMLQHEQQSPGKRRQLRTHIVAKLSMLYCGLGDMELRLKSFRDHGVCSLVMFTVLLNSRGALCSIELSKYILYFMSEFVSYISYLFLFTRSRYKFK